MSWEIMEKSGNSKLTGDPPWSPCINTISIRSGKLMYSLGQTVNPAHKCQSPAVFWERCGILTCFRLLVHFHC